MESANCKKILVAPLDWGLGHTTRCIPIIRHILSLGHHAVFAGNVWQRKFINKTFRDIEVIHLEGYNISYAATDNGFLYSILSQVPRILNTIKKEHDWLMQQQTQHGFDGIISDNRYGLYHPFTPSVIMTHQLQVQTGMGVFSDKGFQKLHYRLLERFGECWVPDVPGDHNLGGKLSQPERKPSQGQYLGLLSQFDEDEANESNNDELLILLSGPEPQRSILSALLWEQVQDYKGKVSFVAGSADVALPSHVPDHIHYYQQPGKTSLLPLLQAASMVICRSGYSTLMDLVRLNKKAIIIPTPGQTEQEYLGSHLHKQGIFYTAIQKGFQLQSAVAAAKQFPFNTLELQDAFDSYKPVLEHWVGQL